MRFDVRTRCIRRSRNRGCFLLLDRGIVLTEKIDGLFANPASQEILSQVCILGSNVVQAIVLGFGDGEYWIREGIVGILQIMSDQIRTVATRDR